MIKLADVRSIRLVPALMFLLLASGCNGKEATSSALGEIHVIKIGDHSTIDALMDGFQGKVDEAFSKRVKVVVHNMQFNLSGVNSLAEQVVRSRPRIIVPISTPVTMAVLAQSRGDIPVVFTFVTDLGAIGYKGPHSIKKATGLSNRVDYLGMVHLLASALPRAKRIGFPITRSERNAQVIFDGFRAAGSKQFQFQEGYVTSSADVRAVGEQLARQNDLILFGGDNNIAKSISSLLEVASALKKPVFACDSESIKRGAVAGYSVDYRAMGIRTAEVCQEILSGKDAESIPAETFSRSKLYVNAIAAQKLGIVIPPELLAHAEVLR